MWKLKYFLRGLLFIALKPHYIFYQPKILFKRLFNGVEKTISSRIYKKQEGINYIDLYGYKFAIVDNLHIFNEFLNELYPFIITRTIDWIIPEGSYFDHNIDFDLKEGDVVIDAGASLGFFSVPAAVKVGKMGKVYAFEPSEDIAKLLDKSRIDNGIENMEIVPFALGEKDEKGCFEVSGEYDTCSKINKHVKVEESTKNVIYIRSIDSFVKENKINRVDFIKMDIEGFERFALLGAKETIKAYKPKLSICTYHLSDDREVISGIIKNINKEYKIVYKSHKLMAY